MQIFSQTSQVASAFSVKLSPGFASAGTVTSTGSSTVPSKPKLTSGSTRIALGAGHFRFAARAQWRAHWWPAQSGKHRGPGL